MELPEDLLQLAATFKANDKQLFVVGGAVRDAVMGVTPKDYDVATDADPHRVARILRRPGSAWKLNEVGKSFGVVKARLGDSENEYEIATFRQDVGVGRRPNSVVFTTIEEDVKRRDLTINALFYDIQKGELVDLVGGLQDIERGIVRTVGLAEERFAEDRLRVLRAIRFTAKLGFQLEPTTADAIMRDNNLEGVSPERIREEFLRTLTSAKNFSEALDLINVFNLWGRIFPGLEVDPVPNIAAHTPEVVIASFFERLPVATVAKRLGELKYNLDEVAKITFLLQYRNLSEANAFRLKKICKTKGISEGLMTEYVNVSRSPAPELVAAFKAYLDTPPVKGGDLMSEGYSGPGLGVELERRETELFKELL